MMLRQLPIQGKNLADFMCTSSKSSKISRSTSMNIQEKFIAKRLDCLSLDWINILLILVLCFRNG